MTTIRTVRKRRPRKRYFVIDFDSTFIRDETIDVLADFALRGNRNRKRIPKKVAGITNKGMDGSITFSESLKMRLKLFAAHRRHLNATTKYLKSRVTPSFMRNKSFFKKNASSVYIVSNGFKECIVPVVKPYGISARHVLANSAKFDADGNLIGVKAGLLAEGEGKIRAVKSLKLRGEVVVIGDGMTDYRIRGAGAAGMFIALTENVVRPAVTKVADRVIRNIDQLLYT